jgi:UDP-glucose 4-epimerase
MGVGPGARMKRILVTGGTGYIGSHACVALLNQGFAVVVADNLCNSHCDILPRIAAFGGAFTRPTCAIARLLRPSLPPPRSMPSSISRG